MSKGQHSGAAERATAQLQCLRFNADLRFLSLSSVDILPAMGGVPLVAAVSSHISKANRWLNWLLNLPRVQEHGREIRAEFIGIR